MTKMKVLNAVDPLLSNGAGMTFETANELRISVSC